MSGRGSIARKLLARLAALVAIAVVAIVVLVLLVRSGAVAQRVVALVLPRVSQALGRDVTVKEARLALFPRAQVTLGGFAVAGAPGGPPLVDARSLDVQVALWPLLRSLGRDIDVRAFTLDHPSVNLVKAKDGSWNYEGLGRAQTAPSPSEAGRAEPGPAAERGAHVAVDLFRIREGAVRVIDRSRGSDAPAVALTMIDLEARGVGPGLPLEAQLSAALADVRQNVHARISVAKLPAGVPRQPEEWPAARGTLQLAAVALDRIRGLLPGDLGAIVRGGTASLEASLSSSRGAYRVEGQGDLREVRMRGQPASGRFRAEAAWSPAKPGALRVDVTDLVMQGPGVDLGGHLSLETAPVRASFVLTGPLLDLDAVMGILPEASAAKKPAPAGPTEVLPESARQQIQAASVRGTIAVEKLRGGRLEATDVKARATLSRGTLILDEMTAAVFGGRVSASGTQVSLAESLPSWKLVASLSAVDLEKALSAFAGRSPLLGTVDGRLDVAGRGTDWEKIREGLTGLAALVVKNGTLTTTDLGGEALGALAHGLDAAGIAGAKTVGRAAGGKTTFRDLAGRFTVKDGFLTATAPLSFTSSNVDLSLGGRVGLDGRLALDGKAIVLKRTLADVVSGLPLPEKVDVPLRLGGTLGSPSVSVGADQAVASLVRGGAKRALEGVRGKAEREGRKAAKGILEQLKRR